MGANLAISWLGHESDLVAGSDESKKTLTVYGIICSMKRREKTTPPTVIANAEEWVQSSNMDAMMRAQDRFTRERGNELRENCQRLQVEAYRRYSWLDRDEPPRAFGAFDSDEIARILATPAMIRYDGFMLTRGKAAKGEKAHGDGICRTTWETEAAESWNRTTFIAIFQTYLERAVESAKEHGAESALRDYRQALQLVKTTESPYRRGVLSPDDALRVIALEQAANGALRKAMSGKGAAK